MLFGNQHDCNVRKFAAVYWLIWISCTIDYIDNYTFSRAQFLQALISLIELPEDTNVPDDEHFIEIEDTPGKL